MFWSPRAPQGIGAGTTRTQPGYVICFHPATYFYLPEPEMTRSTDTTATFHADGTSKTAHGLAAITWAVLKSAFSHRQHCHEPMPTDVSGSFVSAQGLGPLLRYDIIYRAPEHIG